MLNIPGLKTILQTAGTTPVAESATEQSDAGAFMRTLEAVQLPEPDQQSGEPVEMVQNDASDAAQVVVPAIDDSNLVAAPVEQSARAAEMADTDEQRLPLAASVAVALQAETSDVEEALPSTIVDRADSSQIAAERVAVVDAGDAVLAQGLDVQVQTSASVATASVVTTPRDANTNSSSGDAAQATEVRLHTGVEKPAGDLNGATGTLSAQSSATAPSTAPASDVRHAPTDDSVRLSQPQVTPARVASDAVIASDAPVASDPPVASGVAVASELDMPTDVQATTVAHDAADRQALHQLVAAGRTGENAESPPVPVLSGQPGVTTVETEVALRGTLQQPLPQTAVASPSPSLVSPVIADLAQADATAEKAETTVEAVAPRRAVLAPSTEGGDAEGDLALRAAAPPRAPESYVVDREIAQPAQRPDSFEAAAKQSGVDHGARAALAQQAEAQDARRLQLPVGQLPDGGSWSLGGDRTAPTDSLGSLLPSTPGGVSSTTAPTAELAGANRLVHASVRANINWMIEQGMGRATLQLNPAELGALSIKLETQGDQLNVSINAAQAATRDVLEQTLPRLREQLSQQGFGEVNVSLGNNKQQSSEYSQARGDDAPAQGAATGGVELDSDAVVGSAPISSHRGLVDLFA